MRPIFIYRYEKSLMKQSKAFIKLFMTHGEEIQEDFYAQDSERNLEHAVEQTGMLAHYEGEREGHSSDSRVKR